MIFDKIKAPSVREVFVREIENKILSGELEIGEKLPPARELCKIMGVSLTVVNTGISELVGKGFIEVRPRHGTYVADYKTKGNTETFFAIMQYSGSNLNSNEVRSFSESRVALDPFVARLVIERASDEQIGELGDILEQMKSAEGIIEQCKLVTDFFHKMYILSDNTFFALLYYSTIPAQTGMYELFINKNGYDPVRSNAEDIYSSLCKRDVDAAARHTIEGIKVSLEGPLAIV